MRPKVLFYLTYIGCLCLSRSAFAGPDSVRVLHISDRLQDSAGHPTLISMPFAFFDIETQQFYFDADINYATRKDSIPFLVAELKKRSNQQYRLRPLYQRRIDLKAGQHYVLDSIPFISGQIGSGNYDLILTLMSDSNRVLATGKAGFQLLRDSKVTIRDEYEEDALNRNLHVVDLGKTFVANYDLNQLRRNINALAPLAQGIEIKVVKEISESQDLEFMKRFFYNFWYNRMASDPEKAWKDYAEKLNYVARQYGSASLNGYETDRGRIYLLYGIPDKQERVLNEKDVLPYEIWFYNRVGDKGNIKFLFYQPGMVGSQMYLLHSTEESEIINPYWKYKLFLNPENTDNKLMHRVFEYFK